MSLSSYAEVQGAIEDWLARDDIEATRLMDFITLAEAYFNRRLRVRQMEATDTLTTTSGVDTLPSDFLTWRSLRRDSSPSIELEFKHPTWLRAAYGTAEAGTPKFFTIEGENVTIRPIDDDTTYTLSYWQKIPALSDSNTSNWLLAAHPDAYLWGSMIEAFAFVMDIEKANLCKQRLDAILREVEILSEKSKAPSQISIYGTVI